MKMHKTLLATTLLLGSTSLRALDEPNLVINAGGQMRVQLDIPTDNDVDLTTPVTMGRIELQPIVLVPGALGQFSLNHLSLSFAAFDIDRRPFGLKRFRSVGVHLRDAVEIVAEESQPNVYTFTLLPDDLTVYGAALVNGELQDGLEHPSQNVVGILDLNNKSFSAKVVIMKQDEILPHVTVGGPLTITINGTVMPASDKDGDGVNDQDDNCVLTANPRIRMGLGQLVQPEVASPVVTPPADVRSLTCANVQPGDGVAVDICDGLWTTLTNDAPSSFGVGTTAVTWTASTPADRVGTAIQSVTVTDRTLPQFSSVPPAITFPECRPEGIGAATASDDCDGSRVIVTNNAPPRFPIGRTIVTWTARDRAGNRATAAQAVTVSRCTSLP